MNDTRPIVIAVFGLSSREERILQTICFISQTRPRTYELVPPELAEKPDLALVDGQDPKAVVAWQEFSSNRPMLPLVIVGGEAKQDDRMGIRIDRPLLATKLLGIFDQIQLTDEHPAFAQAEIKETLAAQPVPPGADQASPPTPASAPGRKLTALVVDDSLPIRLQMQKELGLFVGQVDLAETGEKAIEFIASRDYDIVFLDVVLPGMDGYQICKTIKRDKRTKGIPVVMLTGKSSPFDRVRGKLAGCDTYLTKPVDLPTFKEVVQQYLIQRVIK